MQFDQTMQTRRSLTALCAGMAGIGLSGCAWMLQPSKVRMDVLRDDRGCDRTLSPDLLVLLPGARMAPVELVQQGFVEAVRQRGRAVDLALPDAHLGYAYDGSMLDRVHQDVIVPARAEGRRRIWLMGISLGGYVALAYAMRHPQQIAGVLALAPYLGRATLLQGIAAAGGAARWRRDLQAGPGDDRDQQLWSWLADPQRPGPPIWLGYGREDRLAPGHRLLADLLPPERVDSVPGGHDWPPWQALWARWLDRGLLPGEAEACR